MTIPTGKITKIFFETAAGPFIKMADDIDNEKLLKLCGKAERQERIGTWERFVTQHPGAMLIRSFETDYYSAVKIVEWIKDYDLDAPRASQYITANKLIGSEDFGAVITLYYSIGSMNISRDHRGQIIRNDIFHYLNAAPLTANEFIMVYETCFFDQGMVSKILNNFARAHVVGGKFAYPVDQAEEIEAHCKNVGLWAEMENRISFQKDRVAQDEIAMAGGAGEENAGVRSGEGGAVSPHWAPSRKNRRGGRGSRGGRGGGGAVV